MSGFHWNSTSPPDPLGRWKLSRFRRLAEWIFVFIGAMQIFGALVLRARDLVGPLQGGLLALTGVIGVVAGILLRRRSRWELVGYLSWAITTLLVAFLLRGTNGEKFFSGGWGLNLVLFVLGMGYLFFVAPGSSNNHPQNAAPQKQEDDSMSNRS